MRDTMKLPALVLAFAMAFNGSGFAQEVIDLPERPRSLDEKAAKAKVEVTKRGLGKKSKVRVKLRDKHELKGHITRIDEDSFQIQLDPDWLDEQAVKGSRLTLSYMEVEKVRGARSRAANIGIGVGMSVAAVALLAAIAVLKADRCRRGNCY
jgi:predicted methyltransferase MtxX (methanogen marker protein 4)